MIPRFYNSLTRQLEPFAPLHPPRVTMYNCGPTVYDFAHIGNFRAFVFADVLRRFLELLGHDVHQVMNLTDVGHMTDDQLADGAGEDKMALAARRLKASKKQGQADVDNPDDPYQVAAFFTKAFLDDAHALRLKIASDTDDHRPRATAHVPQMIALIAQLIERGHAYVGGDGAVYFSVTTFPDYGQLSGNTLDQLRGGAGGRVQQEHQAVKRHPADFLLWKPDPTHLMRWQSPWGEGYPGWHIECSAMAMHVLRQPVIDIHTGGEDNLFPHHECEIAQSRGCTGQSHFARLWMHARFLLVEGEKMSKSKGNFFTLRDLITQGIDPVVVRFELMRSHYRGNLNFTRKGLDDAASAVMKLRRAAEAQPDAPAAGNDHPMVAAFLAALADDLNMAGAVAQVFERLDHPDAVAGLRRVDAVLGVLGATGAGDDMQAMCDALDAARQRKDFAAADRLRAELIERGYEVTTTKQGTTARKKLH